MTYICRFSLCKLCRIAYDIRLPKIRASSLAAAMGRDFKLNPPAARIVFEVPSAQDEGASRSGPSSTAEQGTHQQWWQRRETFDCEPGELRETYTRAIFPWRLGVRPNWAAGTGMVSSSGTAIRSQAWPGFGGQEGSETSGVSPNNNPRHERPASSCGLASGTVRTRFRTSRGESGLGG